jgi:hypothetical protein
MVQEENSQAGKIEDSCGPTSIPIPPMQKSLAKMKSFWSESDKEVCLMLNCWIAEVDPIVLQVQTLIMTQRDFSTFYIFAFYM